MEPTEQEFFTKLKGLMEQYGVKIDPQHCYEEIYIYFKSGKDYYVEDSLNPDSITELIKECNPDHKVNVLDQYIHTDTESSNIITTGSHPGNIDTWKEYEDQARREGRDITGFGLKPTEVEETTKKCGPGEKPLFKNPEEYKEFHKPIVIKHEEIPIKEEYEEKIKSLAKACGETQRNVYQNIVNKSFTGYEIEEIEEPELNEEAISKLCDDMIEAKKEPLSAAQIIDKYARRD